MTGGRGRPTPPFEISEHCRIDRSTLVYAVRRRNWPQYQYVTVWANPKTPTTARCTFCSGPLVAMVKSCPHARAVRRYLEKQR